MTSCGSTFLNDKQQSLGVLISSNHFAPTSCNGHSTTLTPPTSPRGDVVVSIDVVVNSPLKHDILQSKRLEVHEVLSKSCHNLQVEDVVKQGCEDHNARPIPNLGLVHISKEILKQPYGQC